MPQRNADDRHWNKRTGSCTIWIFLDQLLSDKNVGDKWFIIRPFLSHVLLPSSFVWFARAGCFLHFLSLSCCASAWLLIVGRMASEQRGKMLIALSNTIICYFWGFYLHMVFAHTSHVLDHDDNTSEEGCQSQTVSGVTLARVTALASRASCIR